MLHSHINYLPVQRFRDRCAFGLGGRYAVHCEYAPQYQTTQLQVLSVVYRIFDGSFDNLISDQRYPKTVTSDGCSVAVELLPVVDPVTADGVPEAKVTVQRKYLCGVKLTNKRAQTYIVDS
jgi:hypothetical protein